MGIALSLISSLALFASSFCVSSAAQVDSTIYYGSYYLENPLDSEILEPASFEIYYRCTENALDNSSNSSVELSDTLVLAVGNNYSLFFDKEFSSKYTKWIRSNRARGRKITTPRPPVVEPIESLRTLLDDASDIGKRDVGNSIHILKERKSGKTVSFDLFGSMLKSTQEAPSFSEWTIEDGTELILGYTCLKASTYYGGRHYTALFTPDIPISDGPWKFHGLPGMILKVSDEKGDFSYEAIGLENLHHVMLVSSLNSLTESSPTQFEKDSKKSREEVVTVFLYQGSEYQAGEYPYTYLTRE